MGRTTEGPRFESRQNAFLYVYKWIGFYIQAMICSTWNYNKLILPRRKIHIWYHVFYQQKL